MEVTIHMTAANILSKAMALPPTPPQLARKRSWNEMTHVPTTTTPVLHIPAPPALSSYSKKSKRTLATSAVSIDEDDRVHCLGCETRSIGGSTMDVLSADAQQFLADDPFDVEALPHPVLTRQRAVQDVREHMYGPASDEDDMTGEQLSLAPPAFKALPSRWNASVVGASLTLMGRAQSSPFQPRRM